MKKTYEYYIEKGYEPKYAIYFSQGTRKIKKVSPNKDFSLTLTFDNNETRIYDMKSSLKKNTIFEPFIKFENFQKVYIDENGNIAWDKNPQIDSNIVWNNKIDISSDTCYVESISTT